MKKLKALMAKVDWPNQLFNLLGTLLGVLIAFGLSNYQSGRAEQERLFMAKNSIIEEIQRNQNKTKEHLEGLKYTMETLRAIYPIVNDTMDIVATQVQMDSIHSKYPDFFQEDERLVLESGLINFKGEINVDFNMLDISDIAWQSITSLGLAAQMNPDDTFFMFQIYHFQGQAKDEAQKAVEVLKTAISKQDKNSNLKELIFNEYLSQVQFCSKFEEALLGLYKEALERFDAS